MLAAVRSQEVGRLGIAIANQPDIFPINFIVDHSTVVFRTAEGTKLAAAVLGEAVAFECDGYDADAGEAWSVVLKGTAVEVENMYEFFDALDLPLFPWHGTPPRVGLSGSRRPRWLVVASTLWTRRCGVTSHGKSAGAE